MTLHHLMTDEERQREREFAAELKLCAARHAWRNATAKTRKGITSAAWFEAKFGESLSEFAEKKAREAAQTG